MTLAEANIEYAVLKHFADVVKSRMDEIKAAHLDQLTENAADTEATSWAVKIDGEKVAQINLSQRAAAPRIIDESALIDELAEQHDDWLEHTVTIKDWAKKQILDSIIDVTEDGAITKDGELLPGIGMSAPGEPYQTLRWAKDKGDVRGNELGRRIVNDAIADGRLRPILERAGLPEVAA